MLESMITETKKTGRTDLLQGFGLPPLHDPTNILDQKPYLKAGTEINAICIAPWAALHSEPHPKSRALSECLYGEPLQIISSSHDWLNVISLIDGYTGWLYESAAGPHTRKPTHQITAPLVHHYTEPDLRSAPSGLLPMGAYMRCTGEISQEFSKAEGCGWVFTNHLRDIATPKNANPLTIAQQFIGSPYLWGGRTKTGIDCSGLVQVPLDMAGLRVHRDSGPQWQSIGHPLAESDTPQAGDLAFFTDHVGWMVDDSTLLHANGTRMAVTVNPLEEVIAGMIRDQGHNPFLGFKRLAS